MLKISAYNVNIGTVKFYIEYIIINNKKKEI